MCLRDSETCKETCSDCNRNSKCDVGAQLSFKPPRKNLNMSNGLNIGI